jgi:CTP:molybdopterin cytidylyltransferase MocA
VFLGRSAFGIASEARGDEGLGPLLRHRPDVVSVVLEDSPIDVDTPADLARLDPRGR